MNIQPFTIELPQFDGIEVMCVGDFHFGDSFHSDKLIDDIVDWTLAEPNRFITIDGDIFNAAIVSSVSDVYSEKYTLDECMEQFGAFIDKIGKDRILVCIDGNHDQRVWKAVGIDPVKFVCKSHGVRYSQGEAYLSLKIGGREDKHGRHHYVMYRLFITHGSGSGSTLAAALNSVMKLKNIVRADCYIQGHVHKPMVVPDVVYEFLSQGNGIRESQIMYVIGGSCLERGGYSVNKAMPPVVQGSPRVYFDGTVKHMEGKN